MIPSVVDTGGAAASGSTATMGLNPAGADRLILAGLIFTDPAATITSFDFKGSETMTLVDTQIFTGEHTIWLYQLLAPTTGEGTITAVISGSGGYGIGAIAISDVKQSTPLGTPVSNTGTSAAPSIDLTTTGTDSLALAFHAHNESAQNPVVGADQTEHWSVAHTAGSGPNRSNNFGSTEPEVSATTVTLDYSLDASRDWASIAVEIMSNGAIAINQSQVISD